MSSSSTAVAVGTSPRHQTPRDLAPDLTLAMLRDPYRFVASRCRQLGSDVFESRLLLERTTFMTGPAAARLFYEPGRFVRSGAPPGRVEKTLFGRGGVQGLDGAAHRHRKAMFLSILAPESVARLVASVARELEANARSRWSREREIVLYPAIQEVLTRSVCAWAGVPLPDRDVPRRTRELVALFDAAGSIGPRHWWSRGARRLAEAWIRGVVERIRSGRLEVPRASAAFVVATHRELDGALLDPRIAAVEILNLLRPTVAVSVYVTFVAHALHVHRAALGPGGEVEDVGAFVQEVRRYYPFFPSLVARAARTFEWGGHLFPEGRRVVLDLHGTNHDPRTWHQPDEFRPSRFVERPAGPFDLVPQGGGDAHVHHRCPGEATTLGIMEAAVELFARRLTFEVPQQDLSIDLSRLPALPRSRMRLQAVRLRS